MTTIYLTLLFIASDASRLVAVERARAQFEECTRQFEQMGRGLATPPGHLDRNGRTR